MRGSHTVNRTPGDDVSKSYSQRRACDPQLLVTMRAAPEIQDRDKRPASHFVLQLAVVTENPQSHPGVNTKIP